MFGKLQKQVKDLLKLSSSSIFSEPAINFTITLNFATLQI